LPRQLIGRQGYFAGSSRRDEEKSLTVAAGPHWFRRLFTSVPQMKILRLGFRVRGDRGLLLVFFGEALEPVCDRFVEHALGNAEQGSRGFRILIASHALCPDRHLEAESSSAPVPLGMGAVVIDGRAITLGVEARSRCLALCMAREAAIRYLFSGFFHAVVARRHNRPGNRFSIRPGEACKCHYRESSDRSDAGH
jgi:hypothetical protein